MANNIRVTSCNYLEAIQNLHDKKAKNNTTFAKEKLEAVDRIICDALLSDPLELIEIYSDKKRHDGSYNLNASPLNDNEGLVSMMSFPRDNSGMLLPETVSVNIFFDRRAENDNNVSLSEIVLKKCHTKLKRNSKVPIDFSEESISCLPKSSFSTTSIPDKVIREKRSSSTIGIKVSDRRCSFRTKTKRLEQKLIDMLTTNKDSIISIRSNNSQNKDMEDDWIQEFKGQELNEEIIMIQNKNNKYSNMSLDCYSLGNITDDFGSSQTTLNTLERDISEFTIISEKSQFGNNIKSVENSTVNCVRKNVPFISIPVMSTSSKTENKIRGTNSTKIEMQRKNCITPVIRNRKPSKSEEIGLIKIEKRESMSNVIKQNALETNVTRKRRSDYHRNIINLNSDNHNRSQSGTPRLKYAKLDTIQKNAFPDTPVETAFKSGDIRKENRSKEYTRIVSNLENIIHEIPVYVVDKTFENNDGHCERQQSKRGLNNLLEKDVKQNYAFNAFLDPSEQRNPRQKYPVSNNVQPVWKPAGVVRTVSPNAKLYLSQKPRQSTCMYGSEKFNQQGEHKKSSRNKPGNNGDHILRRTKFASSNTKAFNFAEKREKGIRNCATETKLPRKVKEKLNKEEFTGTWRTKKEMCPAGKIGDSNVLTKRSNTSPQTWNKPKSRPGTPRFTSKYSNQTPCRNSRLDVTSSRENTASRKQIPRESRIINILRESIRCKSSGEHNENRTNKQSEYTMQNYFEQLRDQQHSICYNNLLSTNERKLDNAEEPTRDTDSIQPAIYKEQNLSKIVSLKSLVSMKEFNRCLNSNNTGTLIDSGINVHFKDDSKSDLNYSYVSLADASCSAQFSSDSNSISKIVLSKYCQTSLNSNSTTSTSLSELRHTKRNDPKYTLNLPQNSSRVEREENLNKTRTISTAEQEKSRGSFSNTHALSLHSLKEFLLYEGIDIDHVNSDEKNLKDQYIDSTKILNPSSATFSKFMLQKANNETTVIKNSNNISTQTSIQCGKPKSSQTMPGFNAIDAQTDKYVPLIKDVSVECYKNIFKTGINDHRRNVSIMTDEIMKLNNDICTETTKIICSTRSISTNPVYVENVANNVLPKENNIIRSSVAESSGSLNAPFSDFNETLHQQETYKSRFMPSTFFDSTSSVSSSTSSFSESNNHFKEVVLKTQPNKCSAKRIQSNIITAIRIAIIRIQNIYKAIDIYKQIMQKGINPELQDQKILRNKHQSKDNYDPNVALNSSSANSLFNNTTRVRDFHENSANTSLNTGSCFEKLNISSSDKKTYDEHYARNLTKSPVNGLLIEVKSLMEFLLRQAEKGESEKICNVKQITDIGCQCPIFLKSINQDIPKHVIEASAASTKHVLPVIYSVLCSIVFWCLQFSMICELEMTPSFP